MNPPPVEPIAGSRAASGPWDAVVIGAGPAGSVAAVDLARRGMRVLLVDRAEHPREKVCGCCVAPWAVSLLEARGLGRTLADALPLTGVRLAAGRASLQLPMAGYRVLERSVFDARLTRAAQDAGAAYLAPAGALVDGAGRVTLTHADRSFVVEPRVVVVADGLRGSSLRDLPEFARVTRRRSPQGVGAHIERPPIDLARGELAMLCSRDGYLGVVRLPGGGFDVAGAFDPRAMKRLGGPLGLASEIVAKCGGDPDALSGARWSGTPRLNSRRPCVGRGRIVVIGDAASYIEPFTGEGMSWAIASALACTPIIAEHIDDARLGEVWSRRYRRLFARRFRACARTAWLGRSPRAVRGAAALSSWWPRAAAGVSQRIGSAPSWEPSS